MKHILKCIKCSKYTLSKNCNLCNIPTKECKPPKYSPEDRYAEYRRKAKEIERIEKDLI